MSGAPLNPRLEVADDTGRPTMLFLALWRSHGTAQALRPDLVIVDASGLATEAFRELWRMAFNLAEASKLLPSDAPILDDLRQPTMVLLRRWEAVRP